jgi:serine/threonine-protein kinase
MSSSATAPRALQGAVLARRWRVGHKLGEGGMGEVFAADAVDASVAASAQAQRVAVKILRPEFVKDAHVRARFVEEGRTCTRLAHPNIARVIECAQSEDGTPFIVMELLDGVPLGAYTHSGGRVPVAQAVPILQGVLAGLASAHAVGVVHRDLKPDNVMLTRDASGAFTVKVLDFGIAKVIDVAGGVGFRTRTGALLGTPAYMSPEQARSARDVDQRSDLWSAGVLLYEMLTGREAFPAQTDFARLAAVLSVDPEPIDRIDPALAGLAPVLGKAMKKERNERFATAQEMAQALAAAVPSLGLRASGPPQPLARLPEQPARPREQSPLDARLPPGAEPGSLPNTMPTAGGAPPLPSGSGPAPIPIISFGSPGSPGSPASPGVPRTGGSGDTLASGQGGPIITEAPPNVEIAASLPFSGTLQSAGGRRSYAHPRSVGAGLAVVLVLVALVAGFLLGWATAVATR